MKKLNLKGEMFWGALAATTLITPLMIVSAVACVPQVKPFNKLNVAININPVNENLFINQNENLPVLSVEAKVDNPNTQLSYQWYESDSNSTTNGKAIPGAVEATYTLSESDTQNVETKYFYAVVSVSKDNAVLTSKISEIYTININQIPTININKQPLNQRVIINQTQNLPTFSIGVDEIQGAQLKYQWYANDTNSNTNGTIINGAINSSYTINSSSLSTEEQKYFYAKISGSINGTELSPVVSEVANIVISKVPKIIIDTQPKGLERFVNQTTNLPIFSVSASNIKGANLTYQWYKSETSSNQNWQKISDATNSSYTVPVDDVKRLAQSITSCRLVELLMEQNCSLLVHFQ